MFILRRDRKEVKERRGGREGEEGNGGDGHAEGGAPQTEGCELPTQPHPSACSARRVMRVD